MHVENVIGITATLLLILPMLLLRLELLRSAAGDSFARTRSFVGGMSAGLLEDVTPPSIPPEIAADAAAPVVEAGAADATARDTGTPSKRPCPDAAEALGVTLRDS